MNITELPEITSYKYHVSVNRTSGLFSMLRSDWLSYY